MSGYKFLDKKGTFQLENPELTSYLYFPIANENGVMSSVTPYLCGDSKMGQNTFLFVESFWVNKNTKYPDEAAKFAIYMNEKMGKASYETGTGFCGWDIELDESNLNPLFIQIKDLLGEGVEVSWHGILLWNPIRLQSTMKQYRRMVS